MHPARFTLGTVKYLKAGHKALSTSQLCGDVQLWHFQPGLIPRLGRTILWGLMPVIYHLLVQNEPVNTWLIVLSNGAHWGLIYMHAGWVCDQLPVNHQFATAMVWWISVKHICTLLCVHFCFSLTHSSHWVCVLYLYLGVWDETLTPHMYKHSGRLQHVIKLIRSQKKARYYKCSSLNEQK